MATSNQPESSKPIGQTPTAGELAEAARQVATLSAAGMPLAQGLRALASEAPSAGLRSLLERIPRSLEQGSTLDQAIQSLPRVPDGLPGIVRLGQQSGRADLFIPDFLDHYQETRHLQVRLLSTFFYPILLIVGFLLLFTSWISSVIVSYFLQSFNGFGINTPAGTQLIFSISLWLNRHREVIVLLLALIAISIALIRLQPFRGIALRLLEFLIPFARKSLAHRATTGFCRMLARLLEAQIPLPVALRAAGDACGFWTLQQSARNLALAAEQGRDLEQAAISQQEVFPDLAHALSWTPDGVSFQQTLGFCADLHHQQAIASRSVSLMLLESLVVSLIPLGIGMVVLLIYMSLFIPLLNLLNNLS